MGIKIIRNPKGKFARSFDTDPLARRYVDITYRQRGRLGKLLKFQTTKRVKLPKGIHITEIENNSPKVGSVKITFKKIPKRFRKKRGRR